jgi:hypothetical protein
MRYSKKAKKSIALLLLFVLASQLVLPNVAMALTTGPTQPEVQSFEPVGTTDMVDMFSGDFNYNIPLMDVEGYPINISYHGGVTMEQEASWVGLGWNINPGVINRTVRGLPDDFKGDTLSKEFNMKDDNTLRVGIGIGGEIVGVGDPVLSLSADLGANVNYNNYRGVSVDFDLGVGVNLFKTASMGVNIGIGSSTGASIDYNANFGLSSAQIAGADLAGGIGVGVSQGYSTRSGLKDLNFTYSASAGGQSQSFTNTIPIGIQNFVPVITNSNTMRSYYGRVKLGLEAFWCYGYAKANGMFSQVKYNNDGSKDSYGYLYLQNSSHSGNACVLDFTRDKDGQFNKSMQYLPPANLTYDIFSVSGQGTGGTFRPYRNDFGSVYDPAVTANTGTSFSLGLEGGLGWIFEFGTDGSFSNTNVQSGPWLDYARGYSSRSSGSVFEEVYLKQGGELTAVDPQYFSDINGFDPIIPESLGSLPSTKAHSSSQRDPRGNLIYYFTAQEDSISGVGTNPNIVSYNVQGFAGGPPSSSTTATISRIGSNGLGHKKDEISEIVQVQKDGKKFVYGLPALNHVQREATFSVDNSMADLSSGTVLYSPGGDDGTGNGKGREHYYSATITPAYVHSYLLTSVLSPEYVDVTGDGPTDDDLGSFTKLNYTLKDTDYRWKAPYASARAQYNPGFRSDPLDDKGSFVSGSREQWYLHSIETKNFVAEFYVSDRIDGCGIGDPIVTGGCYALPPYNAPSSPAKSYKLDSIKLYNKHDRFINGSSAIPIKSIFFAYSYTLCLGVPNITSGSGGKLTLNSIYFRYGNSDKSMISPYQFEYGYNPNYDLACKDRWGDYKPNGTPVNSEFPFVNQRDTLNDTYASAWSLTKITLPSGGIITTQYESDDYAYVQDKEANEMFLVKGIGDGPGFAASTNLYDNIDGDLSFSHQYIYFERRRSAEIPGLSFRQNYFNGKDTVLYYNFSVQLNGGTSNSYEQIKGYAHISDIGPCPDGVHGFVHLQYAGRDSLNPITYTALNTARYSLPQVVYPGAGADPDGGFDILGGLAEAFDELIHFDENPVMRLVWDGDGRTVKLNNSFIRLQSPGLHKRGGGQRVKSLNFYDSWNALAGGSEQQASYGKNYVYTIKDDKYGVISSGVASYEPQVGGDENPFRQPVPYIMSSGSDWPPNDPVELYQETPIGESLFPSPTVGYSKISVSSIHASVGKSSQGIDVYQYYTAKDFPVKVQATAINSNLDHSFTFFHSKNSMTATQGYVLQFNDMHGKPKSVEHFVHHPDRPGRDEMISYQLYHYRTDTLGNLNNDVNCLVYDPVSQRMVVKNQQLGVEADVTIDSRERDEMTTTNTVNFNMNVSGILFVIIPIPFSFPWSGDYKNNFKSATVTKVIQQYGILDSVQSFNEGALTIQKNEFFDPLTGQVAVTSINNEYNDREYTVNKPAYWSYQGMGPSYTSIKYEQDINLTTDRYHRGTFLPSNNLNVGDELLMTYNYSGTNCQIIGYYMGADQACRGTIVPRFPSAAPGFSPATSNTFNVHIKVISSGAKNLLNETIENYTMLCSPIDGSGYLKNMLDSVISIKARTFADSNTRVTWRYLYNPDTINPFAIGERGIYHVLQEYAYVDNRNYSGTTARTAGLFFPNALYSRPPALSLCPRYIFPYNYMVPVYDPNWRIARTISKWSPNGKEVENIDAVGNYSSSVYGYNQDLPVAVASNAAEGEVLADGFEDYGLLHLVNNLMDFNYSPFRQYFSTTSLGSSTVYNLLNLTTSGLSVVQNNAHTGKSSLSVGAASGGITGVYTVNIPINGIAYSSLSPNRYNFYFGPLYTTTGLNEYLPFKLSQAKRYNLSYWVKPSSTPTNPTAYAVNDSCGIKIDGTFYPLVKKSNIIDGWQQVESVFSIPSGASAATLRLPANYYVDDIRFYPYDANMKSFVYNPVNEKLMATLDENNFATMYEYDQEGNLVRVKKETEKGIMTVSESRSNNPKH